MAQCKRNVRSLLHIRVRWLHQVSMPSEAWAALYTKLAGSRMCCTCFPTQSIQQSVWVNAMHTTLDSVPLYQGCAKISRLGEQVDSPLPFFYLYKDSNVKRSGSTNQHKPLRLHSKPALFHLVHATRFNNKRVFFYTYVYLNDTCRLTDKCNALGSCKTGLHWSICMLRHFSLVFPSIV